MATTPLPAAGTPAPAPAPQISAGAQAAINDSVANSNDAMAIQDIMAGLAFNTMLNDAVNQTMLAGGQAAKKYAAEIKNAAQ